MLKHQKIKIYADSGEMVEAVAPIIVSASRSTDIPAFHIDWFMNRLEKGHCAWINPFNKSKYYVSFKNTRCIVFWSKNPEPIIPKIEMIKKKGINFYLQYTLNDYEKENFEPNVPGIQQRIDTFKKIVEHLGVGAVVWRYDPIIFTKSLTVEDHVERIRKIGNELKGYFDKLVFSFADIAAYKKVQFNMNKRGIEYVEANNSSMEKFASLMANIKKHFGIEVATCGEKIDLNKWGINKNKCIDPELMARLFPEDTVLKKWLGYSDMFGAPEFFQKDPGQRLTCGCILSKDIGSYNTCGHGCVYCYANTTPEIGEAGKCAAIINQKRESIVI